MNLSRRSFLSKGFLACLFAPFAAKAAMTSTSSFVGATSKDFNDAARVSEAVNRLGLSSQRASKSLQSLGDHIETMEKEPPRYGYMSIHSMPDESFFYDGIYDRDWSARTADGRTIPDGIIRGDDKAGWYEYVTREPWFKTGTFYTATHHVKADFRWVYHGNDPRYSAYKPSPTLS